MKIIDVTAKLPFKKSNGKMNFKNIDTVVIHHDAVIRPTSYNTLKRLISEANTHIADNWGHISYHYSIDNVGDVYQCVNEKEICYHAGNYDVNIRSLAIKLDGNMETQQPTPAQIKSLQALLVYLTSQRPDLPKIVAASVKGHRDVRLAPTACPGRNLYPLIHKF